MTMIEIKPMISVTVFTDGIVGQFNSQSVGATLKIQSKISEHLLDGLS